MGTSIFIAQLLSAFAFGAPPDADKALYDVAAFAAFGDSLSGSFVGVDLEVRLAQRVNGDFALQTRLAGTNVQGPGAPNADVHIYRENLFLLGPGLSYAPFEKGLHGVSAGARVLVGRTRYSDGYIASQAWSDVVPRVVLVPNVRAVHLGHPPLAFMSASSGIAVGVELGLEVVACCRLAQGEPWLSPVVQVEIGRPFDLGQPTPSRAEALAALDPDAARRRRATNWLVAGGMVVAFGALTAAVVPSLDLSGSSWK